TSPTPSARRPTSSAPPDSQRAPSEVLVECVVQAVAGLAAAFFSPAFESFGKAGWGDTPNLIFLPRWRLRLRRLRRHRFRPKWTAAPLRLPYERPANPM